MRHFGAQKKLREGIQVPKVDKKYEKIYFLVVTIVHIAYRSQAAIKAELKTEKNALNNVKLMFKDTVIFQGKQNVLLKAYSFSLNTTFSKCLRRRHLFLKR